MSNPEPTIKHPGGRPSSLTPEMLEKARGYLDECQDEVVQVVKQANSEKGYQMYDNQLKVHLPSVAGLAIYLGVARKTIYNWAEANEEFLHILEAVLGEQEKRLIENGLSGAYNPQITKLVLGKHGYSEKQELMGKDGEAIKVETNHTISNDEFTNILSGVAKRREEDSDSEKGV